VTRQFHEAIASMVYRELRNDPTIAVPANQRTLEAAQVSAVIGLPECSYGSDRALHDRQRQTFPLTISANGMPIRMTRGGRRKALEMQNVVVGGQGKI
jgi:hypothetical protein